MDGAQAPNGVPRLNPAMLESFKPAKVFQDNSKRITSLHFDDSGQYLVTASEDDSLRLYDCVAGKTHKVLHSKKYGVHLARFTHRGPNHVLYASTKESGEKPNADTIRFLSTTDNRYISYFHGHKHAVTSLEVSPLDDTFVSASLDGTVRIWDSRNPQCQGCITLPPGQRAVVGIDQQSLVLAVVTQNPSNAADLPCISLFDMRQFDAGAFERQPLFDPTFQYTPRGPPPRLPQITSAKFSPDGNRILVTTAGDVHYIVDSFKTDETQARIGGGATDSLNFNDVWFGSEAEWAPDSEHVITANASEGGTVGVYAIGSAETGGGSNLVCQLDYVAPTPVQRVAFNHRYNMFVSASQAALCFWIPENNV
ncbi:hypothetical protein AMAG_10066 [Allomyces macrogynus ATCC 38327]|uniref:Uncharacterized protein n=1 Tax=Allomyces macrogynus (strain ATCC 38327) TaxID=578462 RepID=A0A0L0SQT1_ALLM3|nr:hypothetical protein AMAG_10066 [Allomyces macrogynus ATCC 38327]|eukprot:KNE64715.1 hypothetical protein AMAG_10066 [Allomyces macrogynus ATCC 38327]